MKLRDQAACCLVVLSCYTTAGFPQDVATTAAGAESETPAAAEEKSPLSLTITTEPCSGGVIELDGGVGAEKKQCQFSAVGTFPDGATQKIDTDLNWKSSNEKVATVDGKGVVTALTHGMALVTAVSRKNATLSSDHTVTVKDKDAKLERIDISPVSAVFEKLGQTVAFKTTGIYGVEKRPDKAFVAIEDVQWQSSTPAVAVIDEKGLVTAKSLGKSIITATVKSDGNSPLVSASTQISVTDLSAIPAPSGLGLGIGDVVRTKVKQRKFYAVDAEPDERDIEFRVPEGTFLRIDGADRANTYFLVHVSDGNWWNQAINYFSPTKEKPSAPTGGEVKLTAVKAGTQYRTTQANFVDHATQSAGVDYGLLVVPYKFHFSDHSYSSGGTIGGYVGQHLTVAASSMSVVLSVGLGNVPVKTVQGDGSTTIDNKASLTVATGLVVSLTRKGFFQAGLLFGYDWAGRDSQYQYEGEPWMALSFGTGLTN